MYGTRLCPCSAIKIESVSNCLFLMGYNPLCLLIQEENVGSFFNNEPLKSWVNTMALEKAEIERRKHVRQLKNPSPGHKKEHLFLNYAHIVVNSQISKMFNLLWLSILYLWRKKLKLTSYNRNINIFNTYFTFYFLHNNLHFCFTKSTSILCTDLSAHIEIWRVVPCLQ